MPSLGGNELRDAAHAEEDLPHLFVLGVDLETIGLADRHAELEAVDGVEAEAVAEQRFVAGDRVRRYVLQAERAHDQPFELQFKIIHASTCRHSKIRGAKRACARRASAGRVRETASRPYARRSRRERRDAAREWRTRA